MLNSFCQILLLFSVIHLCTTTSRLHPVRKRSTIRELQKAQTADVHQRNENCLIEKLCSAAEGSVTAICGSDGRTYHTKCELKRAQCYGSAVQLKFNHSCPEKLRCELERAFRKQSLNSSTANSNDSIVVVPECEADGSYSTVQCHNLTGYCWCVNSQGRPVPRTSTRNKLPLCATRVSGKFERRSSRGQLNANGTAVKLRRGCNAMARSLFSANVINSIRSEHDRTLIKSEYHSSRTYLSERQLLEWKFVQLDRSGDGVIRRRELQPFRRLVRQAIQPRSCARKFHKFCDLNGSKGLDRDEWFTCLDIHIGTSHHLFSSLSQDRLPNTSENGSSVDRTHQSLLALSGGTTNNDVGVRRSFLLAERQNDPNTAALSVLQIEDVDPAECDVHRQRAQKEHDDDSLSGVFIPNCDPNDRRLYSMVQCHGASVCWCMDPVTGKTIPGTPTPFVNPTTCILAEAGTVDTPYSDKKRMIKRCPEKKAIRFYEILFDHMKDGLVQASRVYLHAPSRVQAAFWKFQQLDTNKNQQLERKEWRGFRAQMRHWPRVRRCGRNFIRFCDVNRNKKISKLEWDTCTIKAGKPSVRRRTNRPNPFTSILNQ